MVVKLSHLLFQQILLKIVLIAGAANQKMTARRNAGKPQPPPTSSSKPGIQRNGCTTCPAVANSVTLGGVSKGPGEVGGRAQGNRPRNYALRRQTQ